jgi:methylglutaconyl-CoA hydratase
MDNAPVQIEIDGHVATVAMNDPLRRNALGLDMFDALDEAIAGVSSDTAVHVVLLCGRGKSFCAGFDLTAATDDPAIMGVFIRRLSALLRALRRAPQPVVAAVHGAAIAGGCALVSACDLTVVSATAKLGYPVHALGVSPAVTIPTLMPAIGAGAARALLTGGALIDGAGAKRIGLANRVSPDDDTVEHDARELCRTIAAHGTPAVRATKAWLNELDGSLDDTRFDGPMRATADLAATEEAQATLVKHLRRP